MASAADRKDHPVSMRLPEADLSMIDRAAQLYGRSRTEFVRDAAVRAAEEALLNQRLIRMTAAGFAAFVDVLEQPAAPNPGIAEILQRQAPWEQDKSGH